MTGGNDTLGDALDTVGEGKTLSLVESMARDGSSEERVPTLVVQSGPNLGSYYAFPAGLDTVIVGRGRDTQFRLRHASVSRHHSRFLSHYSGPIPVVEVEDLGSTNGTRVEGRKVDRPCVLRDGDMVHIGEIAIRFRLMDATDKDFQDNIARQVENARRDPLTGLFTRRYLDQNIPGLVHSHRRSERPISLLMLDIDHFKRVNDTYGHLAGDEVLSQVAGVVREAVRSADSAVRFGGEEFCILLPGAELTVALRVAERIRQNIEAIDFPAIGPALTVTASIGAATLGYWETPAQWMDRADKALYQAKEEGRNRCIGAKSPENEPDEDRSLGGDSAVVSTRRMLGVSSADGGIPAASTETHPKQPKQGEGEDL